MASISSHEALLALDYYAGEGVNSLSADDFERANDLVEPEGVRYEPVSHDWATASATLELCAER